MTSFQFKGTMAELQRYMRDSFTPKMRSRFELTVTAQTIAPTRATLEQEVQRLVSSGQKIMAIRLVRDIKGLPLKDCKDYVEGIAPTPGAQ